MNSKNPPKKNAFPVDDLPSKKFLVVLIALFSVIFLLQLLPALLSVVSTLVFALILTALLDPIVDALEKGNINRVGAILLVFLTVAVIALLFLLLSSAFWGAQIESLSKIVESASLPQIVDLMQNNILRKIPVLGQPEISRRLAASAESFALATIKLAYGMAVAFVTSLPWLIVIATTVFFFLKDGWKIKRALTDVLPNAAFEISILALHKTTLELGRYIRREAAVFFMICGLYIVAFLLLGLPYPFFMAVIIALASLIPWFGGPLGFFLALGIALTQTREFGAITALAAGFAAIQLLDNTVISAKIVTPRARFHPLVILMLMLAGGALWGLGGVLVIVPVSHCLHIAATQLQRAWRNWKFHERKRFSGGLSPKSGEAAG